MFFKKVDIKFIYAAGLTSMMFACQSEYEPFVSDFTGYSLSAEDIEKCKKENSSASYSGCELKRCMSSPITLLGLQDLLVSVDAALKKVGIPYFIDAGTAIGAVRFGAHLPWDDDVDLGILERDFPKSKQKALARELANEGLEFAPFHTIMDALNRKGLFQISFNKHRYQEIVRSYKPGISPQDIDNLWIRYDTAGRLFPHLDILVLEEKQPGKFKYQATAFDEQCNSFFLGSNLFPTKPINMLGHTFAGVNNFINNAKVCYKTPNIVRDIVIFAEHKIGSGCEKIRFKNIKDHPGYLRYFDEYLRWVYKSNYQGLAPELR